MATTLVLWDIDHTLIETRGVGGQVYAEAFAKVTGRPLDKTPELAGRTEPVIFREALKINGIETGEDLYPEFAAEQARGYLAHLDELRHRGRALPGAADALRELSHRTDVIQSVLTSPHRQYPRISRGQTARLRPRPLSRLRHRRLRHRRRHPREPRRHRTPTRRESSRRQLRR